MKRTLSIFLAAVFSAALSFAQSTNDFQVLATVKLNKSESVTLKNLKSRVGYLQKQYEPYYGKTDFSVEQKQEVLENVIREKLMLQAAAKENIVVTGNEVDSSFLGMFAQQLGAQITEAQLGELIQNQYKMTVDEYLKQNTGMGLADYKTHLKNQLTIQKYVYSKKMDDLKKVAATDEEIRTFYEMNKKSFAWDDMQKLFLVIVPKANDAVSARAKTVDMQNQYKKDPKKSGEWEASKNNGTAYVARTIVVSKTSQQAQQLGWSYDKVIELFSKDVDYVSDITETETDYQFYVVLKKYSSKLLTLSDVVRPETTITVYDYIKGNLTQQKQQKYFETAALELSKELDTPSNVERKKTGDDLKALLNW